MKAVNVEVPTAGHCYLYYSVSVVIDRGNFTLLYRRHYIYICFVTLLHKISTGVKSHDLPGQAIGPALSTQHCCSSFKSFFTSKNHHTSGLQLLISHKQNPQIEIYQLAVTAKIISQPSIQLCVASVADQSWLTDFHGLHERLLVVRKETARL